MSGEMKHGVECIEFEAMLCDGLEGLLRGPQKERFEAHRRACPSCALLIADVQAGQRWLESLEEVEPPAHLVHNILAATTGISSNRLLDKTPESPATPLGERIREWWDSYFTPLAGFVRQPRFVMSFGMIFFSFSLGLNVMGVKAKDISSIDLRPASLKHSYYTTQGRVVKFFENIRIVYEMESRVREIRRITTPAEPAPAPPKRERKDNTSGQPEQRQERNYSQEGIQPVLAELPNQPPATTETALRRDV